MQDAVGWGKEVRVSCREWAGSWWRAEVEVDAKGEAEAEAKRSTKQAGRKEKGTRGRWKRQMAEQSNGEQSIC